jgi:AmpD protein
MRYRVQDGWLEGVRQLHSPNCGERPGSCDPDLLVIHNISLPPGCYGGDAIERFFTNCLDWEEHPYYREIRGMEVSSHLLLRRDGDLVQFVSFNDRAWHAGASCFDGRENCNDFSIGIELEGTDDEPYTDVQYAVLADVSAALLKAFPGLEESRITGHSDIAPGRKTDPGPAFDWRRYRDELASRRRQ